MKTVLVGARNVGKTSLITRVLDSEFPRGYVPSVSNFGDVLMMFKEIPVQMALWDTAGDDYDRLRPLSYLKSSVIVVAFSLASEASLDRVRTQWVPEARQHTPNVPIVLVGTKADLRRDDVKEGVADCVSREDALQMADLIGAVDYCECSSLSGAGMDDLLDCLAAHGYEYNQESKDRSCVVS